MSHKACEQLHVVHLIKFIAYIYKSVFLTLVDLW